MSESSMTFKEFIQERLQENEKSYHTPELQEANEKFEAFVRRLGLDTLAAEEMRAVFTEMSDAMSLVTYIIGYHDGTVFGKDIIEPKELNAAHEAEKAAHAPSSET